jgi:MHS family alpha-ketoglutarate permease-like MFS transporter
VQLLQTAAIFFLGFVARPIGAWLMGLYADRKGRKRGLSLGGPDVRRRADHRRHPHFKTIGLPAPAILLLARVLQGLSVGGEYGASATYMSEMAGKKRRGFWSSFHYVTLIAGQLVAALVCWSILQNTLSKADLADWGWRIPFFIGAALAVVVFWIRTGMEESISQARTHQRDDPVSRRQVAWVSGLLLAVGRGVVGLHRGAVRRDGQYGAVALSWSLFFVSLIAPLVRDTRARAC